MSRSRFIALALGFCTLFCAFLAFAHPLSARNTRHAPPYPQALHPGGGDGIQQAFSSNMRVYVLHLHPGQDLNKELTAYTLRHHLQAGVILTCVGSLTDTAIRYANKDDISHKKGHFEITSLVGTLDPTGGHVHLTISDGDGNAYGGHLEDGCLVYTTAEIAIGELPGLKFAREHDSQSTYEELMIYRR